MTSPTATGLVGEKLVMETRSDTRCEQEKSRAGMLSDQLRSSPSVECETTRGERGMLSPARLAAQSNSRTTNFPVDCRHCDTEQRTPSEERRGTNGEHDNAGLVSNAMSISEDLRSILDRKDSELDRLRLVHQKALSARDRQIRSLQADIDSLTSQLTDRMRQVQVVQEANQLKDEHIDLLKNIVKDLQTKITSPKHSVRPSRETIEDLKSQIRRKDEELALAKSKIAELRKQVERTLSPERSAVSTPLAHVQDDGVAVTLEQAVDLTDDAELPRVSPTQSHYQEAQPCPDAFTTTLGSEKKTDRLGTKSNASSQTSPDTVQESMSEVVNQLARTKDQLAAAEEDLKQSVDLADKLNRELKSQRNFCLQQEKLIDDLKAEMRSKNAQLLDNSIQCLQAAISEKDSSIALVEMQGTASLKNRSCIHGLKQEKSKLMKELKEKMAQKINLLHMVMEDDDEEHCRVSQSSDQEYSLEEVCEAIRVLEQSKCQLRGYIDQLLALVLDRDPSLLEGLPRIQQNNGMSPDLLRVASLPELLLELREDEEDMYSLRSYTALLLQKISEYSPDLLKCVDELCLSS